MGRWAQRTRRGGGPPIPPTGIHMVGWNVIGFRDCNITFDGEVTAADFAADNFTDLNSGAEGGTIENETSTVLHVSDFNDDVTPGHTGQYVGTAPGVVSPQTVAIT